MTSFSFLRLGSRRARIGLIAVAAVVAFVAWSLFGYQPVTHAVVVDGVCLYCHEPFDPMMAESKRHPENPEKGAPVTCVDCHAVPGIMGTTYVYTHLAVVSDFYGNFRSAYATRAGDWVPPLRRRALRVRQGLEDTRSASCLPCHTLDDPVPEKRRGQRSHKTAKEENQTCIECHYNLVHREVKVEEKFAAPEAGEEEEFELPAF